MLIRMQMDVFFAPNSHRSVHGAIHLPDLHLHLHSDIRKYLYMLFHFLVTFAYLVCEILALVGLESVVDPWPQEAMTTFMLTAC